VILNYIQLNKSQGCNGPFVLSPTAGSLPICHVATISTNTYTYKHIIVKNNLLIMFKKKKTREVIINKFSIGTSQWRYLRFLTKRFDNLNYNIKQIYNDTEK